MSGAPPSECLARVHLLVLLSVGVGGLVAAGISMADGMSSRAEGKGTGTLIGLAGIAVLSSVSAWRSGAMRWAGAPWWMRPGPCLLAFAVLAGIGAVVIEASLRERRASYLAYHAVMADHSAIYRAYRSGHPLEYLRTADVPAGRREWLLATVERHAAARPGPFPPALPERADAATYKAWQTRSPAASWLQENDREEAERSQAALAPGSFALWIAMLGVCCVILGCLALFPPVFPRIGSWASRSRA